jgi:hypothetical protein
MITRVSSRKIRKSMVAPRLSGILARQEKLRSRIGASFVRQVAGLEFLDQWSQHPIQAEFLEHEKRIYELLACVS